MDGPHQMNQKKTMKKSSMALKSQMMMKTHLQNPMNLLKDEETGCNNIDHIRHHNRIHQDCNQHNFLDSLLFLR